MSGEYYYLAASLPHLGFNEPPPLTKKGFLEECGKWLRGKDMAEMEEAGGTGEGENFSSPLLARWRNFDLELKKDLAAYREERKKGSDRKPGALAGKILSSGDPLEMEKAFEKERWDFLENLEGGHYFDLEKIFVYYLKLEILLRLAKFNKDKGENIFHEICEVKYDDEAR